MKVIIDFDNTFYTVNRDIDDGLALLYLRSCPEVEVIGVTSTFGNGSIEEVDNCTKLFLEELGMEEVPYAKGGSRNGDYLTPASQLLVDLVEQNAGEVCILATGSMTNLQGAFLRDPDFFNKVNQVVLMGGTTSPLIFDKQEMLELNFSCDPQATYSVLKYGKNVSIMTGNHCLDLLFTRDHYEQAFAGQDSPVADLIRSYSDGWFVDNEEEYGIKGYYNWDSLAAAYLVHPEYFQNQWQDFTVSIHSLAKGSLIATDFDPTTYAESKPLSQVHLNTPLVKRPDELRSHLFESWLRVELVTEIEKGGLNE